MIQDTLIHQTALVSPKATIGTGVRIGAFSIVEDDVIIGDDADIRSSVVIANGARIGNECVIFSGSIIGTAPQDLKYCGQPTEVFIGARTVVREYATINRGTQATGKTTVGEDCMIMAYCHVAHDCTLGNHVIMANLTQLAGHVTIEDWVILSGAAKILQFCTVGKHAMIGADTKITKDVAPFLIVDGKPPKVGNINQVGLSRRGFSREEIADIDAFYTTLLRSGLNTSDGIAKVLETETPSYHVYEAIEFIIKSKKGIHR